MASLPKTERGPTTVLQQQLCRRTKERGDGESLQTTSTTAKVPLVVRKFGSGDLGSFRGAD
jgi:hypothetical protein